MTGATKSRSTTSESDLDHTAQIKEKIRKSRRVSFLWTLAGVAVGLASIFWAVAQSLEVTSVVTRDAQSRAQGDALRALAPLAETLGVQRPPEDYAKLVSVMQEAGGRLATASEELPTLRLQKEALEAETKKNAAKLAEKQVELMQASAAIPALKQMAAALESEKSKVAADLDSTKLQLESVNKEVPVLREKAAQLEVAKNAAVASEKKATALETQKRIVDADLDSTKLQLESVKKEVPVLREKAAQLEVAKTVAVARAENLANEKNAIKKELTAKSDIADQFRKKNEKVETQVAALTKQVGDSRSAIESAEAKFKNSESSRKLLEQEKSNGLAQIDNLTRDLSAKTGEVADLKVKLKALEENNNSGLQAKIDTLTEDLRQVRDENGQLAQNGSDAERSYNECDAERVRLNDQVNSLTGKPPDCRAVEEPLRQELAGRYEAIDALTQQLRQVRDENGQFAQKVSDAERNFSECDAERRGLIEKPNCSGVENAFGSQINDITAQLGACQNDYGNLSKEYDDRLANLGNEHNGCRENLNNCENQLKECRSALEQNLR